jgi:hypothetical protein
MRTVTLSLLVLLAGARVASAQPIESNTSATLAGATHGTGLGVGAMAMLAGPFGASVAYDAGPWHLDTLVGLTKNDGDVEDRRPSFTIGGRFWFHLHKSANAEFSVGGGLGFTHAGPAHAEIFSIEGGGLLRAFIASNVALSFSVGLAVNAADRSTVAIGGQLIGGAGVHYYFY